MPNIDDYELLRSLAYQSWLDRGQPFGSPEIDWLHAQEQLQQQAASMTSVISGEPQADSNSASNVAQLGDSPPRQQRQQQGDDQATDALKKNTQTETTTAAAIPTINDAVRTPTSKSRSSTRRLKAEVPMEVPPSPTTPPDQPPTKAKSERSSLKKATGNPRNARSALNDGSRL